MEKRATNLKAMKEQNVFFSVSWSYTENKVATALGAQDKF